MYANFYRYFGLRANPFNTNPDPTYLFVNQRTQTLLDELASAIQARKGLMLLTGEAGTGKTTLINLLRQWLQKQQTPTAFLFNPRLEVNELFDLMLAEFGISAATHVKGSALARLNHWLTERYRMGRNAVLILDEAQCLPVHVLEEIRRLLNHEIPQEKLLQIVLSGQPELEETLKKPDLRQIQQRISLRCHTMALTAEEAQGYIQKRLQVAGGDIGNVFAPGAIEGAYVFSNGIPRVMNLLCEHAMIRAYLAQTRPVPACVVAEVARQLQFDDARPVAGRWNFEIDPRPESSLVAAGVPAQSALVAERTVGLAAGVELIRQSAESRLPEIPADDLVLIPESPGAALKASESMRETKRVQITSLNRAALTQNLSQRHLADFSRLWLQALKKTKVDVRRLSSVSALIFTAPRKAFLQAKFADWQRSLNSLVRWLQEPLPNIRVPRRTGH
jgi:general secretion pathway protein A